MTISALRAALVPREGRKRGQTLLIFGLAFVFLMGIVGLATDGAYAYFRSISMERAAAAAALAGVPYMPKNFTAGAPNDATDRAKDEAKRNGFADGVGGVAVVAAQTTVEQELSVTITAPSPTFFMAALGLTNINIARTAVAGYKPPIALGQPGNQIGATVSALGAGTDFYFARYKGWTTQRSEGDAYTPNPNETATGSPGGGTSADVHVFSKANGIEAPEVDCTAGTFKMPCRGGYNWRIVVPDGQSAEIDIYNAANAPDYGRQKNTCENSLNLPSCNSSGYHYHEDDLNQPCGGAPSYCSAGNQAKNNATGYTLFDVPNTFLRSKDVVLSQSIVYPIDATNYNGTGGAVGPPSAVLPPTYINVKDNTVVTQYYAGSAGGSAPCNMKIYHAWMDLGNYDGRTVGACTTGDGGLVKRTDGACSIPCNYNNSASVPTDLGPGTYRVRVDALNFDGSFGTGAIPPNTGASSKGYAIRVVKPGTNIACTGCYVAGWEEMCVYTPLNAGIGTIPLFELTKDYAGATIDVDVFDVGDSSGNVDLAIIDPITGSIAAQASGTLLEVNNGISRLGPFTQHVPPQFPAPKPGGVISKGPFAPDQAGYRAADSAYGKWFQGTWIRISIPIPSTYNPPSAPRPFWMLQYTNTGGANDTFTFAVSARGGPVHLLKS